MVSAINQESGSETSRYRFPGNFKLHNTLTQQQSRRNNRQQQNGGHHQEAIGVAVFVEEVFHGFVPLNFFGQFLDQEDAVAPFEVAGIAVFGEDKELVVEEGQVEDFGVAGAGAVDKFAVHVAPFAALDVAVGGADVLPTLVKNVQDGFVKILVVANLDPVFLQEKVFFAQVFAVFADGGQDLVQRIVQAVGLGEFHVEGLGHLVEHFIIHVRNFGSLTKVLIASSDKVTTICVAKQCLKQGVF